MARKFDAIFEDGVLKPLQPLGLPESRRVTLTVADLEDEDWMDIEFMDACGSEADPTISLEQVRAAMSKIRGSMTEISPNEF